MAKSYVYREVVGISTTSIEEAIKNAVAAAGQDAVSWFEVLATRGRVTPEGEYEYQVTVKCGCINK